MRVIQVVAAISEEASGPSYSVRRLCESLIAQNHEVQLATLDWAATREPPYFLRTFALGIGPRRLGRSPLMLKWLREEAATGAVDLIHNHGLWMMPNIYAARAARKGEVPLVVSPRGTLSQWAMKSGSSAKAVFWPLLQKRALEDAQCFHATSKSEYEEIRRLGFRQPVAIIPNGIDIPLLSKKNVGPSRTLLFLGRLHPIKGLDMLLFAWKIVQARFPDWRLIVAGPDQGGHRAKMEAFAAELGLQRVEFVGPLYGEDKWRAYQDADLFILPTYSENFGIAVAEALAAGTPAIVTKGAPWEELEVHQAGWWVDISAEAVAIVLAQALSCPREILAEMGLKGRRWMEQVFAWNSIGCQMAETYVWILQGGARPPWVYL